MKYKIIFTFIILFPLFLLGYKTYQPWYTGPLIASGANNLEKGKFLFQPYLYYKDTYGLYNKGWGHHSLPDTFTFETDISLQAGITSFLDMTAEAKWSYREKENQKSFEFGDTTAEFGLQVIRQNEKTLRPSIRLTIKESFPTGKYKNLNPDKFGIDSGGSGSYETTFSFLMSKIVYFITNHPISWILNLSYTIGSNVNVSNFNTYGGGYNTKGRVKPAHIYSGIFAFEFSFTKRWVYAMDFVYINTTKTKFNGYSGLTKEGTLVDHFLPSTNQFSIAPALEYNFNSNLGVIGGLHFSIRGKNSTEFISGILSVAYSF